MTETPEERARRLGLTSETPDERAARLGVTAEPSSRDALALDVRQKGESTMALPHNRPNRAEDTSFAGISEGAGKVAAALPLVAAQIVPGAEKLEAMAGSLGSQFTDNPMSVDEARDALRSVTDKIPTPIKMAAQLPAMVTTGSGLAQLPKIGKYLASPAAAGAALGAADQALSADDMSLEERLFRTAGAGAGGAVIGKTLDALITGGRAIGAQAPDANAMARKAATKAESKINYKAVRDEAAAAGGTSPEIQAILKRPDVAPWAARVRQSRKYANADDATVLQKVFKRMGKQESGIQRRLREQGYDDVLETEAGDLADVKKELVAAGKGIMPSLPRAIERHAENSALREAVETGSSAAARITGAPAKGKSLTTQSKRFFEETIRDMPPERKKAAIEGVLGGTKERIRPNANPVSGFGAFAALHRPARVASFLRTVGDPTQVTLDQLVRSGMLGATTLEELIRQ